MISLLPPLLSSQTRRGEWQVTSTCNFKSTDLRALLSLGFITFSFQKNRLLRPSATSPPSPSYLQQQDSLHAVRIDALLFHGLPWAFLWSGAHFCSRPWFRMKKGDSCFSSPCTSPTSLPRRIQHRHHPTSLLNLCHGDFLADRLLWARTMDYIRVY